MLSIVIVSYNRERALLSTLREVSTLTPIASHAGEIIVVDNASTDASVASVRAHFPGVTLIALDSNTGIEAFNVGVRASTRPLVLILDDDARPDPAGLEHALALMQQSPDLGGVALLPVHPASRLPEWPFATAPARQWPFMGCGNLVRREAWDCAGGYDQAFFLYRNDCDLALKLLASGHDVAFDPTWIVWHDSPAATQKSPRWLELATRNWCWLCRRHGTVPRAAWAIFLAFANALRLAGPSPSRLARVAIGLWRGLTRPVPPTPAAVKPDGTHLARLLRLRGV